MMIDRGKKISDRKKSRRNGCGRRRESDQSGALIPASVGQIAMAKKNKKRKK